MTGLEVAVKVFILFWNLLRRRPLPRSDLTERPEGADPQSANCAICESVSFSVMEAMDLLPSVRDRLQGQLDEIVAFRALEVEAQRQQVYDFQVAGATSPPSVFAKTFVRCTVNKGENIVKQLVDNAFTMTSLNIVRRTDSSFWAWMDWKFDVSKKTCDSIAKTCAKAAGETATGDDSCKSTSSPRHFDPERMLLSSLWRGKREKRRGRPV